MLDSIRNRITYFWESREMEKAKPAILGIALAVSTVGACVAGVLAYRANNS